MPNQNMSYGSTYRTYVYASGGTSVSCDHVTPARAARLATLSDVLRFYAPGARTSVFDPLVAAIVQDLEELHQMVRKGVDDLEASEDVLVNDLARHLDELQEKRRERLLVGTTQTGDGENRQGWAFYLFVPASIESCSVFADLTA